MNDTAVLGFTGFVGSNIVKQLPFPCDLYNSKNFNELKGKSYKRIYCACVSGVKWKANLNPKDDYINISKIIKILETVECEEFYLVSSQDCNSSLESDEEFNSLPPTIYGIHRLQFEWFISSNYLAKILGKESIKEINKNINYIEEVYSYIKCDDYHCIYIMNIGVLDEFRKMKIGSKLIEKIINIGLNDILCIGVFLEVIYYNNSAIKFYKKNEFKKVMTNKNYYNIKGNKYDAYTFLRIFTRKEKDNYRNKNNNVLKKILSLLINPIFMIFKIIIYILFFQCFRNKIKIE